MNQLEVTNHNIVITSGSGSFVSSVKNNKVVEVDINLQQIKCSKNNVVIANGLPKPLKDVFISDNGGMRLRVNTSGSLMTYWSNTDFDGNYGFTMFYLTND